RPDLRGQGRNPAGRLTRMPLARARWPWLAAALATLAALLAWLATAGVAAQLEARARADAASYAAGDSPFRWTFSAADALVGPPLGVRIAARDQAGIEIELPHGQGELGLRLSGQRIHPAALPR